MGSVLTSFTAASFMADILAMIGWRCAAQSMPRRKLTRPSNARLLRPRAESNQGDRIMKCTSVLVALPLLALAACSKAVTTANPETELAAIRAVEKSQQTAFNSDDLEGAVAPYAEGAIFVGPGEAPARGIEAIRASAEAFIKDPNMSLSMTGGMGWVAASGDLAVTTGNWTLTMSGADGKAMVMNGINQSTWQKQADGWKMVLDFNQATPAEPALTELPE
jgi:uncharacterized protein (TIGR02246 family)